MINKIITRRDFLRKTVVATLFTTIGIKSFGQKDSQKKVRVILARHQNIVDKDGRVNQKIFANILDDALVQLFETKTPEDAWKLIIKPIDIVGIKTNVWRYLPTPKEVENIIIERLLSIGVDGKNIGIGDRGVLTDPIFDKATALINIRPMRAHHWSGVGGCLKNYIMFVNNPSDYHSDSCADLGALWNLPIVKGKTRLNILLMLTPQFHCLGPHHFDKEYVWQYKGILVGTDPVALDAVGLKIIEAKRRKYFKEDLPIRPLPKHVIIAEKKHGIGIADLDRIEVIKIGWKEGILI